MLLRTLSQSPVKTTIRLAVSPLVLALVMMAAFQPWVTASESHSSPEDSTVIYNGKCPGDRDDDCRG